MPWVERSTEESEWGPPGSICCVRVRKQAPGEPVEFIEDDDPELAAFEEASNESFAVVSTDEVVREHFNISEADWSAAEKRAKEKKRPRQRKNPTARKSK